ncbi:MAG: hypothetical protein ACXVAE_01200 [Candidatus Limnocylindrales bacterium]
MGHRDADFGARRVGPEDVEERRADCDAEAEAEEQEEQLRGRHEAG